MPQGGLVQATLWMQVKNLALVDGCRRFPSLYNRKYTVNHGSSRALHGPLSSPKSKRHHARIAGIRSK